MKNFKYIHPETGETVSAPERFSRPYFCEVCAGKRSHDIFPQKAVVHGAEAGGLKIVNIVDLEAFYEYDVTPHFFLKTKYEKKKTKKYALADVVCGVIGCGFELEINDFKDPRHGDAIFILNQIREAERLGFYSSQIISLLHDSNEEIYARLEPSYIPLVQNL